MGKFTLSAETKLNSKQNKMNQTSYKIETVIAVATGDPALISRDDPSHDV